mmetsp:Transcript_61840/g.182590  ORF Transcript_61840/g.182590 Transcript_61840/m.182590 type:complete len:230 (-) Transcript_61840:41-730(-)
MTELSPSESVPLHGTIAALLDFIPRGVFLPLEQPSQRSGEDAIDVSDRAYPPGRYGVVRGDRSRLPVGGIVQQKRQSSSMSSTILGQLVEGSRFVDVGGHGLLHQQMLPRLQYGFSHARMMTMRDGDEDAVQLQFVVRRQQFFDRSISSGHAVPLAQFLHGDAQGRGASSDAGRVGGWVDEGDHVDVVAVGQVGEMPSLGPSSAPDHGDAGLLLLVGAVGAAAADIVPR